MITSESATLYTDSSELSWDSLARSGRGVKEYLEEKSAGEAL